MLTCHRPSPSVDYESGRSSVRITAALLAPGPQCLGEQLALACWAGERGVIEPVGELEVPRLSAIPGSTGAARAEAHLALGLSVGLPLNQARHLPAKARPVPALVYLSAPVEELPTGLNGLVVNGPEVSLSPEDLQRVDELVQWPSTDRLDLLTGPPDIERPETWRLRRLATLSRRSEEAVLQETARLLPELLEAEQEFVVHALCRVGPVPPLLLVRPGLFLALSPRCDPLELLDAWMRCPAAHLDRAPGLPDRMAELLAAAGSAPPERGFTHAQRRRHAPLCAVVATLPGWECLSPDPLLRQEWVQALVLMAGVCT